MKFTIVSGGQTGVDRAALDTAIKLNIPHGGWCPKGRRCESKIDPDGSDVIPPQYLLEETTTADYSQRTMWNIRDSDATLIILPDGKTKISDGTILTINEVKKQSKPFLITNLSDPLPANEIIKWIFTHKINILNIAGPRESQFNGIYEHSRHYLETILKKYLYIKKISEENANNIPAEIQNNQPTSNSPQGRR